MFKRTRFGAAALAAICGSFVAMPVFAQGNPPQQLQRIEITGSNIKRTSREGSSPLDVITAKEIAASGAKTVLELMKLVPSIGNDGFNDTPNQNGFSRGVATVGLRNLSATSTLILLNGRRMTPSSYANPNNGTSTLYDLNSIPLSAIERVEVYKDGASAVYGSDAIGGVINFITRNDFQGLQARAVAGMNGDREYKKGSLSLTGGIGDYASDGFNVFVGVDLSAKGRSMEGDSTNSGIQAADYRALNLRQNPYGSFLSASPFFTREGSPGNRSFPQTNTANVVNRPNCPASQLITQVTGGLDYGITTPALRDRAFCNFNLDQFNEMQNPGTDGNLLSRATLRINNDTSAFAELAYSRSERRYLAAPRTINGLSPVSNFLLGGAAPSFQPILEIGHPDNPFPNARAAVQMRFENVQGGNKDVNEGYRGLAGVKGTVFGNWDWESALLWNRSDRESTALGFLRLPVLRQLLGAPGPTSGRSLASIAADPDLSRPLVNKGRAEITQLDGKVSTEFGALPGGPIGTAFGVELRRESIEIIPDPENATGNILGLSNTAVQGSRNVRSAFVEFRLPVLKQLDVDVAGRVDKYPGIKTNFVPKAGFKWTANEFFTLRGSYSEGFRAPAVSQVSPGGAQFFVNNLRDPVRCNTEAVPPVPFPGGETADCNKSVSGQGGANPALRPEKSYGSSLGFILSPVKNLDILISYFKIRKNGEVALGSAQSVIDNPQNYPPGSLVRDPNPALQLPGRPNSGPLLTVATPWTNQGSTMVSGWDFEVRTSTLIIEDQVKWTNSLNGTSTRRYERIEQPGFPSNNLSGTRGGLADFATTAPDIPRLKFRLTSTFETGPHSLLGAVNYVSGVSFIRQMDGGTKPPRYYTGQTCHYGGPNFDTLPTPALASRNLIGAEPSATNGRDLYINRYPECALRPWTTFDLGYTYTGIKDLTLSLTVTNFTNEKAPYDPGATYLGYNTGLHNGVGRYYTLSAGYKFW
jgi:iron complex outermembrane recepter protein